MGNDKPLGEWTLEELVAENDRLWEERKTLKKQQGILQPFLDAAWKAKEAADAAKGDPNLEQRVG